MVELMTHDDMGKFPTSHGADEKRGYMEIHCCSYSIYSSYIPTLIYTFDIPIID